MFKLIRRFFTLIFLIIIGVPTFFVGQVWYSAKYSKAESAKVAVVLGAAQFDGRPSDALEARLVEAIRIYKMGMIEKIVTVGGGAPGDRFTEARAGRKFLISNGIPRKSVIEIPQGRRTYSSTKAYTTYLKTNLVTNAIVVTDPYHCRRATTMANDLGISTTCSPVTTGPYSLKNSSYRYLMRESVAYVAYLFLEKRGIHVSDHLENSALNSISLG
jgi:vancomycin permeability regulator SanA